MWLRAPELYKNNKLLLLVFVPGPTGGRQQADSSAKKGALRVVSCG